MIGFRIMEASLSRLLHDHATRNNYQNLCTFISGISKIGKVSGVSGVIYRDDGIGPGTQIRK